EDRQGVLWIGTESGLTKFEQGRFESYGPRDGLQLGTVWASLRDRRGRVWLATDYGLVRFDGRAFSMVSTAGIQASVQGLAEGPQGDIWASTWEGVAH